MDVPNEEAEVDRLCLTYSHLDNEVIQIVIQVLHRSGRHFSLHD